jgi:transcription-repair coupling factor (superfamily II helicase)
MEFLLKQIHSLPAYQTVLASVQSGRPQPGLALPRAARLPVLAALHADLYQPVVLVTDRADHALQLHDELAFWMPGASRYIFAEPNPLFYENAAWGNTTRRERLETLTVLSRYYLPFAEKPSTPPVIIVSARALMTYTLPRRDFLKASKQLKIGQSISPNSLLEEWMRIGYQPADTVLEPGQFSHRGGLFDIWPQSESGPVRLDFFGDEIDTIRRFDPGSQRTIEKLDSILVTPAREFLLQDGSPATPVVGALPKSGDFGLQEKVSEFHIPLLHSIPSTLLDYLPQKSLILVDDMSILESAVTEIEEQAVKLRGESIAEGIMAEDFPVPYISWSELADNLQNRSSLELGRSTAREGTSELSNQFGQIERFGGRLNPFTEYLAGLVQKSHAAIIVSRQCSRLEELWNQRPQMTDDRPQTADHGSLTAESGSSVVRHPSSVVFIEGTLSEGWQLGNSFLITDSEIFGWERPQPRQRPRPGAETPEAAYADLNPGDWVVHVDYGVGRYTGLVQRTLEGLAREFLCVEYKNGDQVYVPIHQADRLTRYVGPDGSPPSPGSLGTQEWTETRRKVQEAVKEVAHELLDLYARRQVAQGFAFSPDNAWQGELESSFPYVETEDQVKALVDIKRDMETPRPMDRLLCGDVGYGKTEVALRAAFKAVMDGRQVAVLVPTTVLAQQHYDTFRQRLSTFPVTVEMLSRFRTPREQDQIIYGLTEGAVDIVIGTHRLISADVQFKDLGLVIIDEEQRFGVTHKEHLKKR